MPGRTVNIKSFDAIPRSAYDAAEVAFHRAQRPLLLGEVSTHIGWSLDRTEQIIERLCFEGTVRRATQEELLKCDVHPESNAFALVGPFSLQRARW